MHIILFLILGLAFGGEDGNTPAPPPSAGSSSSSSGALAPLPKSEESQGNEIDITSTIKIVREGQDGWEVLFDEQPDFYKIISDDQQSKLMTAYKRKQSITVRADGDTRVIKSVGSMRPKARKTKGM